MKMLSFLTLSLMLSISACSHHKKESCHKEKMSCTKEDCKKDSSMNADKKCSEGSCSKEEKKSCCSGDSCQKKS